VRLVDETQDQFTQERLDKKCRNRPAGPGSRQALHTDFCGPLRRDCHVDVAVLFCET
jgi:hypothetical protein